MAEIMLLNCTVVGQDGVGRTSLVESFTQGRNIGFGPVRSRSYDSCITDVIIDGKSVKLYLLDTRAEGEFDRLRPIVYPATDVFIICFSLVDPNSYENVRSKWYPEVRQHNRTAPVLLVGNKLDLRNDERIVEELRGAEPVPITSQQGLSMAEEIKAINYLECSALTRMGVDTVFEESIRAALEPKPKEKCRCLIM